MFNKLNIMVAIRRAVAGFSNLKLTPENISVTNYSGVGPKKGVIALHRDIKRQKLSRYPKVHQGAGECERRAR